MPDKTLGSTTVLPDYDLGKILPTAPRILVLRVDRIGDVLISQPFLRLLRARFPNAQIDICLGERNEVMKAFVCRYADEVVVYRKSVWEILLLIRRLRRRKYDLVIDLHDNASRTSSLLMKFSAAGLRLGFCKENAADYTHCIERADRSKLHIVDLMCTLMRAFGVDEQSQDRRLEAPDLPYHSRAEHEMSSSSSLEPKSAVQPNPQQGGSTRLSQSQLIFINISAGKESMWWGTEKWIAFARALQESIEGAQIYIGSDSKYAHHAEQIAAQAACVCAPQCPDLESYSSLIRKASFLVTPDTSIVHLAAAAGLPEVVMYARPHPDRMPWYPYGVDYEACVAAGGSGQVVEISVEDLLQASQRLYRRLCSGNM